MLILRVENLRSGASFGGPFYYDISTIEKQDAVFPGLIDWYVSQYSQNHNRVWSEEQERTKIRERYEERQKQILKESYTGIGNKLDSLIQADLDKFKKMWEQAEELLKLKEAKDWERVFSFAGSWQLDGLKTRLLTIDSLNEWVDPVWANKI